MKRVGIWFSPSKWTKFQLEEFIFRCRDDFEVVQIDMTRDIESQGPFHVILHKVVNTIKDAEKGDRHAQECIDRYEKYIKSHPEILVLDSLDACRKIVDRGEQCRLARQCEKEVGADARFFAPDFVDIRHTCSLTELKDKLTTGGIHYPFITKCVDAQAVDHCHQMALVFSEEGLRDVQMPCVVQNFVNHSGTLFKMFCLGEDFYVVGRKSIKNFNESGNNRTTFFDSRDISKENSKSVLTEECTQCFMDREGRGLLPAFAFDVIKMAMRIFTAFSHQNYMELIGFFTATSVCRQTPALKFEAYTQFMYTLGERVAADDSRKSVLPDLERFAKLAKVFRSVTHLELFGVDFCVEDDTGRYAAVDINVFPGFDGVPDLHKLLREFLLEKINEQAKLS